MSIMPMLWGSEEADIVVCGNGGSSSSGSESGGMDPDLDATLDGRQPQQHVEAGRAATAEAIGAYALDWEV